ncbi:RNA methyltransferase [Candidatus Woesearchaeota archaeon]|nr:RNA methyltransferase [Candidatus Woesearchaeota archaeon]
MAELTVIIVGIEHPGNLGAVARAMKNFGVAKLVLVDPKCSVDEEAKNRAKWANAVLENATTGGLELLEEFDLVVGTTAELGNDFNLPRTPLFPAQLAERLAKVDGQVALVFGRESDGLTNEELGKCDLTVTIPANEEYPVLNLSHAVAVTLYAITSHEDWIEERYPLVRATEKRQLQKMLDETLDSMSFQTAEKKETQRILWKRLIGKSFLTQREAMALLGFLKKARK